MIPNGKEMDWNGHHLVFESTTYQCRGCFFEDRGSCPDCDEGLWVEDDTEGKGERNMTELAVFHVNPYEDRRKLAGILADNGYPTMVEDRRDPFVCTRHEFYVHVYEIPKDAEEEKK